ncbi:hypothetical protein [Actinoplanes sp. URMC 104]|uniref:hypothetical protein n=1 Tax=Actinoplanes sp. URMC 104 TaxID=3423409 RepID=UPI003F1C9BB5
MATLLGRVEAAVMPERRLITLIGAEFDGFEHPDPDRWPLCWAGTEQIHLFSELADGHQALVTAEAWDGPAPALRAEATGVAQLRSISGRILISILDERALTDYLQLGEPGDYTVDVQVTGRQQLRALSRQPAWYDSTPRGVEHFQVRLWPSDRDR